MKVDNINVTKTVEKIRRLLEEDKSISTAMKALIGLLFIIITTLVNKLNINSSNSSKPPSADPNRTKKAKGYTFILVPDLQKQETVEAKHLYFELKAGVLHYKCLNLSNEIVQDIITAEDLPKWIQITSVKCIKDLLAIKKFILGVTYQKGYTKKYTAPGGQPGHKGVTLEPVANPDEVKYLDIDKRTLPKGMEFHAEERIARQIVEINISRYVIEYRAEVLVDNLNNQYIAEFPKNIGRPIQYGSSVKAKTTYLSVYQLIPYERIQEQFTYEYNIPLSTGTICNNNAEASKKLLQLGFDDIVKRELVSSVVANADETSINLNGHNIWLHGFSNKLWTWMEPHDKRGTKAMHDIGILPLFLGILCHDHWKAYFQFLCKHSLCNAHHLRELTRAFEHDSQQWAQKMFIFLQHLNKEVGSTQHNVLSDGKIIQKQIEYREILEQAEKECPAIEPESGKKRKPKQGKSRNLLVRLRDYENEVLRFMSHSLVPFTNNDGEGDIRMFKVQQKISGCFKSMDGARNFCRVRSFLATCKKHDVPASEALDMLFNDQLPPFMSKIPPPATSSLKKIATITVEDEKLDSS